MSLKHQGEEILDDRIYKIAASQGIIEALKQVKEELPGLGNIEDTHIELWPVLREYFKKHTPIHPEDEEIKVSGRIRTVQPDLMVLGEYVKTHFRGEENHRQMHISIKVQNFGYGGLLPEELEKAQTDPTELAVYYDMTPEDTTDDIDPFKDGAQFMPAQLKSWKPNDTLPPSVKLIEKLLVPSLKKDEWAEVTFDWDISSLAPSEFPYAIYIFLKRAGGTGFISVPLKEGGKVRKLVKMEESNLENNKAKVFMYLDPKVHPKNN